MPTTMITGASGFIGTHLMAEMARRGLPRIGVSRQRAPDLVWVPSYGANTDWSAQLSGVDAIVHLAARVHVMRETNADPLGQFRKANVEATLNLARQAASAGLRRFIFVSSIKVNGERTELGKPFTALDQPRPLDDYGISKAEAEAALFELSRETGLEVTIVRPPLVYGAGAGGNFLTLKRWAESPIPSIFSAIENKRSFIHVANLCDLLIHLLVHRNAANRVFLASDGHDLSTHELMAHLKGATGRRAWSIPVPRVLLLGIGQATGQSKAVARLTESLQVDIANTCTDLSWRPPLSITDAMHKI